MILNDSRIRELCDGTGWSKRMIVPYHQHLVREEGTIKVISYGQSSFGYDIRVGNEFKIFTNIDNPVIDPKAFDADNFVDRENYEPGSFVLIPPNSFALCASFETIDMPDDVMAICIGKSSYARCGIIVNVTPIEPGWRGTITIEISNTTPNPAKIYVREGIAQLVFFRGERPSTTYAERKGKYQGQSGITLPLV